MGPFYIFVTGGVVSSLGKGITAASLGRLLKARGLSVFTQKLDPYLNFDPGTMSPYQHGEVFVTEDGAETDLDLGHYERFIDVNLSKASNITTGRIYWSVISKEREGAYLGATVQIIPHVINEIKDFLHSAEEQHSDVIIAEIGGTVGDIESQPFLEAIRQMRNDLGRDRTLYIHVTLLPFLPMVGELKTKPTQHSVKELTGAGIQPDVIILRSEKPIEDSIKDKISLLCNVEKGAVIANVDCNSIYDVPLMLEEEGLATLVCEKMKLDCVEKPDLNDWVYVAKKVGNLENTVRIGLVGKYTELKDAYLSVSEALFHAGLNQGVKVSIEWINSELIEEEDGTRRLEGLDGIIVPGGFGERGIEGMIAAGEYARLNRIPYLGLCLGLQTAVIEFTRHVLGYVDANSTEFDPATTHPVIDIMSEQRGVVNKGGTMRLGSYPCVLREGTRAHDAYKQLNIAERHRHRYEVNNDVRGEIEAAGMIVSGLSPDGRLVEMIELADHPWFVATQAHPEFKSRPNKPHPLFYDFVSAARTLRVGREGSELEQRALGNGR